MKKNIFLVLMLFIKLNIFSEEYSLIRICKYSNDINKMYRRKDEEVGPYDDSTGNTLKINLNGEFFVFQSDKQIILRLNTDNYNIFSIEDYNLPFLTGIIGISENTLIFMNHYNGCFAYDSKSKEKRFLIENLNFGISKLYYDEETDILFLQDKNEQLYSIINPGLDEEQNKKNFKTPEETLAMLNEGKYAPHLEIREELNWQKKSKNYLYIDGKRERWGNAYEIGKYICSVIPEDHYINLYDGKNRVEAHYELPNGEQLESNAFHPCGDVYFLTMNWTTNTHNLYRIENTWDPEWRKEWYENHETENVSQNILSTNVTVNKEMTCSDNLRLRSEEATSSRVITTMQKGTKVKILKLGKSETIDGITSNWVQVEVLSGAKDKDGKALKAGIIGWCYGGYLE